MVQLSIFIVISVAFLVISSKPLHHPGSHGFYRFFAWEAILGLIVLNVGVWFQDPFSWYQIISWVLLIVCIVPLIFGVQTLRTQGRPDKSKRPDDELLGFERTTELVTSGIYRYIRHPLYSSLLLLAWGTYFKTINQAGITLVLIATLLLDATAKADEEECIQIFGKEYQEYMQRTKKFIPYVF